MFTKVFTKFFINGPLLQRCAECIEFLLETLGNKSDRVIITKMSLLKEKKEAVKGEGYMQTSLIRACRMERLSDMSEKSCDFHSGPF